MKTTSMLRPGNWRARAARAESWVEDEYGNRVAQVFSLLPPDVAETYRDGDRVALSMFIADMPELARQRDMLLAALKEARKALTDAPIDPYERVALRDTEEVMDNAIAKAEGKGGA